MKDQSKTKDELVKELQELRKENSSLKALYEKDITERKRAEEALKENEEQLRNIFENSTNVFYSHSVEHIVNYISPQIENLLGYTQEEAKKKWTEFASKNPINKIGYEHTVNAIETGKPQPVYELELVHKSGKNVLVEVRESPIVKNGKTVSIVGAFSDISERKQAEERLLASEERFRQIAENSQEWIWEVDSNGLYTYASQAAEDLLGYKPEEIIGKKHFYDFFLPEEREELKKVALEMFKQKQPFRGFINRNVNKDGKTVIVSTSGVPMVDDHGKLLGYRGSDTDITEIKRAEEALRTSEAYLSNAATIAKLGYWEYDVMNDLFTFNDKFYDIFHTTAKEVGGYKMSSEQYAKRFLHPDDIPLVGIETQKAIDTTDPNFSRRLEHRILFPDGKIGYISVQFFIVKDSQGHTIKTFGVNQDITESKLAEEKIREKDIQFRKLSANVPDLIFQFTRKPDGTYCVPIASEGIKKIFGCSPEDVADDFAPIASVIYPEDAERVISAIEYSAKHLTYFTCEFRVQVPEKEIQWIYSRSSPEKLADGSITWYGFNADITEMKQTEMELVKAKEIAEENEIQLSAILENSPTGFAINRISTGEVTYVNKAFADAYHIPVELCSKVSTFFEYVYGDQIDLGNKILNDVKSEDPERMRWNLVPITDKKTNSTHYVSASNIIVRKLDLMISTVIDITSQVENERELKYAKEKAQESDRLKSAFLANMSHEIRTPMNGILGFSQLLKEPNLTGEEQQEYIKIIERSGARMLNIINDIVSISKIESGQMEITISETDVNKQIEFVYSFFKPVVEGKGIQFIAKKALPSNEAIIKSDREKIYAILTNLVGNATKFTRAGSIEFGYEKKGKYLEFFVKDTGVGIADEKKGIIFERFRQGSESHSRAYEGAGLGLSISKAYIEMLGGKTWVESELGKGSTFYFTIPYNAEREVKTVTNEPVTTGNKDGSIKNLKILVVEDDESSEMFLSTILTSLHNELLKAKTGVEAIEICRNNPDIDLVLMDVRMPIMDGHEATRLIREFNKDVIIIAQTAYGLLGDRQKAIEAGCTDYISKPIDVALLKTIIRKHLKK